MVPEWIKNRVLEFITKFHDELLEKKKKHQQKLKDLILEPWLKDIIKIDISRNILDRISLNLTPTIKESAEVLLEDAKSHWSFLNEDWNKICKDYENYLRECKNTDLLIKKDFYKLFDKKTIVTVNITNDISRLVYEKIRLNKKFKLKNYPKIEVENDKISGYSTFSNFEKELNLLDFIPNQNQYVVYAIGQENELNECLSIINKVIKSKRIMINVFKLERKVQLLSKKIKKFKEKLGYLVYTERLIDDCNYVR